MKSISSGRAMARARSVMNMAAPLSTPMSSGARPGVVRRDLRRRARATRAWRRGRVDDDLAEVRAVDQVLVLRLRRPPLQRTRSGQSTSSRLPAAADRATAADLAGHRLAAGDGEHAVDGGARRAGAARRRRAASGGPPGGRAAGGGGQGARRRWGRAASGQLVEQLGVGAEQVGLAGEHGRDVALGDRVEERAAARGGRGCGGRRGSTLRRVVHRLEARGRRTARGSRARRSRRSGRRGGVEAGEAVEAGAAEQVEQHGLGLVVGGVAGEHVRRAAPRSGRARARASRFGPGGRPRPAPPRKAAPKRAAAVGDDVGLRRRTRPQPVVDVDGGDVAPRLDGQHEQRERVGAAGHRAGRPAVPGRRERAPRRTQVARRHEIARSRATTRSPVSRRARRTAAPGRATPRARGSRRGSGSQLAPRHTGSSAVGTAAEPLDLGDERARPARTG